MRRTVAQYTYVTDNGTPVVRIDRVEPGSNGSGKDFYPHLYEHGTFRKRAGLDGKTLPLYHADELAAARDSGATVFFTEGEGKADDLRVRLRGAHSTAVVTTIAGGAKKPLQPEHLLALRGFPRIIILSDSDETGRAAAQARAARIIASYSDIDVRIVDFFPLATQGSPDYKKDIADWFAAGGTLSAFFDICEFATKLNVSQNNAAPTCASKATAKVPATCDPSLFNDIKKFIRPYIVLADTALTTVVLWVLHTHTIAAAEATPYLHLTSPQRQCGKTRLLEVLDLLVWQPWFTARTSAAALVRKVSRSVTLLHDEIDASLRTEREYVEALRGILNAGYRRGGAASICVGRDYEVRDFPVFGPKAFAGIGSLPDTIADRSIRIELERRRKDEHVERFRRRKIKERARRIQPKVLTFYVLRGEPDRTVNGQMVMRSPHTRQTIYCAHENQPHEGE